MLKDVIGQQKLKNEIMIAIKAAKFRKEPLGHIFLTGVGGLGKTFLLNAICDEIKSHLIITQGKRLSSIKAVKEFFLNGKESAGETPVFYVIDEIHEMTISAQEELYYPMDKGVILTTSDPISLGEFTLAGATTDPHELNGKSLINRFDHVWELQELTTADLMVIVASYFEKEKMLCGFNGVLEIANRCKGLPRLALCYAARARDRAQCNDRHVVTKEDVLEVFKSLEIDKIGLDKNQKEYLTILNKYGKPLGIESISGRLDLPLEQVKYMIEPYLRQKGMVTSSTQGREITTKGVEHILNGEII